MDNNNYKRTQSQLPDSANIVAVKRYRKINGNEKYLEMVTQQKMMNMHPCQRRIRTKKEIKILANNNNLNNNQQQERNESLEDDNILIGDDVPKIINDDGLFMRRLWVFKSTTFQTCINPEFDH
jgi:hypothetical protein